MGGERKGREGAFGSPRIVPRYSLRPSRELQSLRIPCGELFVSLFALSPSSQSGSSSPINSLLLLSSPVTPPTVHNRISYHILSTMSVVSLLGVKVLNNPAPFTASYQFEITFECLEQLQKGKLFHKENPPSHPCFFLLTFYSRSRMETDLRRIRHLVIQPCPPSSSSTH